MDQFLTRVTKDKGLHCNGNRSNKQASASQSGG